MKDRVFTAKIDEKDVSLKMLRPKQSVASEGDFIYRKYFAKAIREDFLPNAEIKKKLRESGLWGDSDEQELAKLRKQVSELSEQLEGQNREDGIKIFSEIKKLRDLISEITDIQQSLMQNSAETFAQEVRTQFIASECAVYNDSGKRVFSSLEDFMSRLDEDVALQSYQQAWMSHYEDKLGIEINEALTNLPEDVWMKEQLDKLVKEQEDALKEEKRATRKKRRATKKSYKEDSNKDR